MKRGQCRDGAERLHDRGRGERRTRRQQCYSQGHEGWAPNGPWRKWGRSYQTQMGQARVDAQGASDWNTRHGVDRVTG